MKRVLSFLIYLGTISCLACLSSGGFRGASKVHAASEDPLAGTRWRLVEFQSMDDGIGVVRPHDRSLYTLHLRADGTVAMRLNCNHASGQWSAEAGADETSGRFALGPLAVTHALCPPPSMDKRIAAQAQHLRSFLLKDDRLYLSLMADGGIYVWEPETFEAPENVALAAPEEGGPRYWEVADVSSVLILRARPSTSANVVATLLPGRILDNLGCDFSEGRVWCYVQPFGGGPVGYVAADFLTPASSPDGRVMTGPNDSALRAGQAKFDARGTLPCAQYRGQPMVSCQFGVARAGGGDATVVIKKPDDVSRAIFFRMGRPMSADTSEADGHPELEATKENDLHLIRVGEERYEIPDAVIWGG